MPIMHDEQTRKEQKDYLQKLVDKTGWSLSRLAVESGLDPSTLTRFFNSPDHNNNLTVTTLKKIESRTTVRAPMPNTVVPIQGPPVYLEVVGKAAAGAWLEVGVADEYAQEIIPVGSSPRYGDKPQYVLRIEGNSINKHPKGQNGDYAVCVQWDSLGLDLPDEGKFVHVERSRAGMIEVTIKQFCYIEGQPQLCPYSDDPKHQECLELGHSDEDTTVQIKGLVIGWFSHQD